MESLKKPSCVDSNENELDEKGEKIRTFPSQNISSTSVSVSSVSAKPFVSQRKDGAVKRFFSGWRQHREAMKLGYELLAQQEKKNKETE